MTKTAAVIIFLTLRASAEVPAIPLPERIASADIVVVGKIGSIKKRAAHVKAAFDGREEVRFFDVGTLKVTKYLKHPKRFADSRIPVAFKSGRLPGEFEDVSDYGIYYKDGDEGIWFLRWSDSINGKWISGYDFHPLAPLTAETEITAILKGAAKTK